MIERTLVRFFRDFPLHNGKSRVIFDADLMREAATVPSAAFNGRDCCSGAMTDSDGLTGGPPAVLGQSDADGRGAKAATWSAGDDGGGRVKDKG